MEANQTPEEKRKVSLKRWGLILWIAGIILAVLAVNGLVKLFRYASNSDNSAYSSGYIFGYGATTLLFAFLAIYLVRKAKKLTK